MSIFVSSHSIVIIITIIVIVIVVSISIIIITSEVVVAVILAFVSQFISFTCSIFSFFTRFFSCFFRERLRFVHLGCVHLADNDDGWIMTPRGTINVRRSFNRPVVTILEPEECCFEHRSRSLLGESLASFSQSVRTVSGHCPILDANISGKYVEK